MPAQMSLPRGILLGALILCSPGILNAEEVDQITTKDGSVLRGKIAEMTGGSLKLTTAFNEELTVKWAEIAKLNTARPLPFVLKDGTSIKGVAKPGEAGEILVTSESVGAPIRVKLEQVQAINPPPEKAITFDGAFGLGAVISDGNTKNRSASSFAEFVARSKRQRLTLGGYWNYADDGGLVIVRNAKAAIKYDFFITKRLYTYVSAFFEGDKFQDLTLRTALSTGLGLQLIDKGDFESALLKDLTLSVEGGIAYFDEDFRRAKDDAYVSGRWAVRLDWPLIADRLGFFHYQEGYPSFENQHDVYVISQGGIRLNIVKNFNATIQVNYRWDNTPAPGFKRADTLYLLTLGYTFSF